MIKIRFKSLFAALALAGLSSPALANNMVTVPTLSGGFMVGVSGLYFVPGPVSSTNYGSYVSTHLTTSQLSVPSLSHNTTSTVGPLVNAHTLDADPGYSWGFALHLGYIIPCTGNDILLNWNHLNTSQHDHAVANGLNQHSFTAQVTFAQAIIASLINTNTTGSFIAPFIGGTDATTGLSNVLGNAAPFRVAHGSSSIQWDTVDLNFGQHVNIGGNFDLRMFGGLAWARINNEREADYAGSAVNTSTVFTSNFQSTTSRGTITSDITNVQSFSYLEEDSTFKGFGPELGFDGHYCITNTNFGFAGHLGAQMLIGDIDTDLHFRTANFSQLTTSVTTIPIQGPATTVTTIGAPAANYITNSVTSSQNDRLVPVLDANLGIDYTYNFANCHSYDCNSSFVAELGYQATKYYNAVRTFDYTVGNPGGRLESEDAFFHGPFLTVKFLT